MRRSSGYKTRRGARSEEQAIIWDTMHAKHAGYKGQWFIISAIVISSAFLAISTVFRGYVNTDTALPHLNDDGTFFDAILESIKNIEDSNDCTTMGKSMEELVHLLKQQSTARGIVATLEYDVCATEPEGVHVSLLQTESEDMKIWMNG